MTTLTLTDPVNGTVADANTIASNNTAIKSVVNGNIDNANVAVAANISGSKLLDGSVTNAKLVAAAGVLADMPPGRELLYTEYTAPVSITATTVGTANTIVTASAFTFDNVTPVIIEFFSPRIDAPNSATPHMYIGVFEDGTQKAVIADITNNSATAYSQACLARYRLTPSNASHTYSIRGYMNAGATSQTVNAGTGGSTSGLLSAGYIRVTKA